MNVPKWKRAEKLDLPKVALVVHYRKVRVKLPGGRRAKRLASFVSRQLTPKSRRIPIKDFGKRWVFEISDVRYATSMRALSGDDLPEANAAMLAAAKEWGLLS